MAGCDHGCPMGLSQSRASRRQTLRAHDGVMYAKLY